MKKRLVQSTLKAFCLIAVSLLITGCKVELYSGLSEKEGNEMLAILLDGGIETEKLQDKDKNLTLKVKPDEVSKAIRLLKSYGYPKEKFSSIGDIFPKEGLISSPTEERARYTYSMSQELASTLSMIDGVINARVHVVLPQEPDSLIEITYPSSASIFIKYTPELELAGFIPKVKTLVANSIEGLSLDKITVSLFPATRINQAGVSSEPGEKSNPGSTKMLKVLVFVLVFLLLLAVGGAGFLMWMQQQGKPLKLGFLQKTRSRKKSKENDFDEEMNLELDE
ncbi:type III secretion inner membrane ring lipoprotein SctJ [Endozoicomonas sp. Mp262]|uniref:type III secretion system inner membrane ring lipoprotein SctJ n=1 Tax=Endozoicomonas sp. Mp262 TaxID=2919499 RepID=UPI0021D93A17